MSSVCLIYLLEVDPFVVSLCVSFCVDPKPDDIFPFLYNLPIVMRVVQKRQKLLSSLLIISMDVQYFLFQIIHLTDSFLADVGFNIPPKAPHFIDVLKYWKSNWIIARKGIIMD